jgi:hypothetical protein
MLIKADIGGSSQLIRERRGRNKIYRETDNSKEKSIMQNKK